MARYWPILPLLRWRKTPNLNTMYAGTGEGYQNIDAIRGLGIYKSTDGGITWSLLPSTTTAAPM